MVRLALICHTGPGVRNEHGKARPPTRSSVAIVAVLPAVPVRRALHRRLQHTRRVRAQSMRCLEDSTHGRPQPPPCYPRRDADQYCERMGSALDSCCRDPSRSRGAGASASRGSRHPARRCVRHRRSSCACPCAAARRSRGPADPSRAGGDARSRGPAPQVRRRDARLGGRR